MTPLTPAAPVCTEACWTPVECPTCGRKLTPRGRSAPLECFSDCCEEHKNSTLNRRHLWDEHDSTRIYTDPVGWEAHVKQCKSCQGEGL
ncbi:MAG: hypothetical protein IT508_12535 [Burkholderiaceae bacterium]|nr:hypothetical protein [Burkholderiaceae bacterium]